MNSQQPVASPASVAPAGLGAPIAALLVAGLVGGGIVCVLLETRAYPFVKPNLIEIGGSGMRSTQLTPDEQANFAELGRVKRHNEIMLLAVYGMLVGGLVGGVEGWSRRRLLIGLFKGVLAGCALGAVAGCGANWALERFVHDLMDDPIEGNLLLHAGIWAVIGLGLGLGLGMANGVAATALRTTVAGFCGGLCAGAAYLVVMAVVRPSVNMNAILPDDQLGRIIWALLPVVIIVALAWLLGRGAKPKIETASS